VATLCSPYADDDQGLQIMPEVGSQVVVAFEAGNLRRPYVLGAAGTAGVAAPHAEDANNIRCCGPGPTASWSSTTRRGAKVSITMAAGHKVVLDDGTQQITIEHANGSTSPFDAAGTIAITAPCRSA